MMTAIEIPARKLAMVFLMAATLGGLQIEHAAAGANEAVGALAYASQTETLYKSDGRVLYRSADGGKEWAQISLGATANDGRITAVAISPAGEGSLYVAGPGIGILKSIDDGKSWTSFGQGLPSREVVALAAHSTASDTLYAVVAEQGIYRTEDGGEHWRTVDKGPQAQIRRLIHSDLEGSMQSGWMFAATDRGVYRGMDCFCGWRTAGNSPDMVSAVAHDPKEPKQLYAAAGRQVFSTANGGEEWQPAGSPGGEVGALAHSSSGVLYALLADGRVVKSMDKGKRWE